MLGSRRTTTTTIAEELAKPGIAVSPNTVARLLHHLGYSLRANQKQISTGSPPSPGCRPAAFGAHCYRLQTVVASIA